MNISAHLTYEKASSLSVQNSLGLEYNKYTDKGCIHVCICTCPPNVREDLQSFGSRQYSGVITLRRQRPEDPQAHRPPCRYPSRCHPLVTRPSATLQHAHPLSLFSVTGDWRHGVSVESVSGWLCTAYGIFMDLYVGPWYFSVVLWL